MKEHPSGKIHFALVVLRNRQGIKFWLRESTAWRGRSIGFDCHSVLTVEEKYFPIFDKLEERINKYFNRYFMAIKGTY